jgi:hypothetical protein
MKAAYCRNCNHIFEFETRDNFKGELFCPDCISRVGDRYPNLERARVAHPDVPVSGNKKVSNS